VRIYFKLFEYSWWTFACHLGWDGSSSSQDVALSTTWHHLEWSCWLCLAELRPQFCCRRCSALALVSSLLTLTSLFGYGWWQLWGSHMICDRWAVAAWPTRGGGLWLDIYREICGERQLCVNNHIFIFVIWVPYMNVCWPKISGRRGRPPPTIFLLKN